MSGQTSSGVPVPPLRGNEVIDLVSGGRNQATTQEIADLASGGGTGTVTSITTTGPGISGGPISTTGALAVQWNAGAVSALGMGLGLSAGTLVANGLPSVFPQSYGTITDGGRFGDGLTHPASSNGFSTLAALQAQFLSASFTATGSSTNLTVSSVTGYLYPGVTLGVTTGIGSAIKVLSQTSGTLGGAGVYVTSGSTTISAAAATASWAGATSDDMAGLMIQAAIQAAHLAATGGIVYVQAGSYILPPFGLAIPADTTMRLIGDDYLTFLLCQNCTGRGAVCIYRNSTFSGGPISHISLCGFNAGRNFGSATNAGVPYTSMYTSGTVGLYLSQQVNNSYYGVHIFNFDEPYGWDLVAGDNFCLQFRDSTIAGNNKGVTIGGAAPNSNEAMRWVNCSLSNNNYGFYILAQSSGSVGSGSAYGMDVYFDGCQFDYNIVSAGYYLGFGGGGECPSTIFIHMSHVETSTDCSGTAAWFQTDGIFYMDKCYCYCANGTPLGVTTTLGFWSTVNLTNNIQPGTNVVIIPLYYTPFGNLQGVYLAGNSCRITAVPEVAATGSGNFFGQLNMVTGNQVLTSNYTFNGQETNYPGGFLIGASINFTVPLASSFNYVIGTQIKLTSLASFTGTIVATGGVTITTSGIGLTFGGAKPATVFLTKVGTNAWTATGNMT